MNELDFTLELTSEDLPKALEYDLFVEAETQLKQLAEGHTDMTGAAVTIKRPHVAETPLYEVTVTVYARPEHIAASEKETDPQLALRGALQATQRQIQERREKLKKRWEQPGKLPVEKEITEIVAAEASALDEPLTGNQ